MVGRYSLTAWRAPLAAPPPAAAPLEPRAAEEVLVSDNIGFWPRHFSSGPEDRDSETGYGPGSDAWAPVETAIATIWVDDRVQDITVSSDGERVYIARS